MLLVLLHVMFLVVLHSNFHEQDREGATVGTEEELLWALGRGYFGHREGATVGTEEELLWALRRGYCGH
jgi:hypothetical protein